MCDVLNNLLRCMVGCFSRASIIGNTWGGMSISFLLLTYLPGFSKTLL